MLLTWECSRALPLIPLPPGDCAPPPLPRSLLRMASSYKLFTKRALCVRNSVPDDVFLCELGRLPLHLL